MKELYDSHSFEFKVLENKLRKESVKLMKFNIIQELIKRFNKNVKLKFVRGRYNKYRLFEEEFYFFQDIDFEKDVKLVNDRVAKEFNRVKNSKNSSYLYKIPKISYIEPEFGYIIINNQIVFEGLPHCNEIGHPKPSSFNHFTAGLTNNIDYYKSIISFRDVFEENYWHFYNNIIPKFMLLDKYNISKDIPVVVSERLYKTGFFQKFLKLKPFKDRTFIVQGNRFIKTDEIIFCKTRDFSRSNFDFIRNILPDYEPKIQRKIFSIRKGYRSIKNLDQTMDLCLKYGFEIVDNSGLSLTEQVRLYSETRYLIGLHGAALTNMIFRKHGEMDLLEIFAQDHIAWHYFWLARYCNFNYDMILGEKKDMDDPSYRFSLDCDLLEEKIVKMLDSGNV